MPEQNKLCDFFPGAWLKGRPPGLFYLHKKEMKILASLRIDIGGGVRAKMNLDALYDLGLYRGLNFIMEEIVL